MLEKSLGETRCTREVLAKDSFGGGTETSTCVCVCVCQYQPRALFLLHCWRDIGCDIAAAATSVPSNLYSGSWGCSRLHVANNDAALKSPCCCFLHSPHFAANGNPAKTRISVSRCISNSRCTRSFYLCWTINWQLGPVYYTITVKKIYVLTHDSMFCFGKMSF